MDTLCKGRAGKAHVADLSANQGPPSQAGTVSFQVDEDRIGGSAIQLPPIPACTGRPADCDVRREGARAALDTSSQWVMPTVVLTAAPCGCRRRPPPGTAADGDSRLVCLKTATAARVAEDGDRRLVWLSATGTAIYG